MTGLFTSYANPTPWGSPGRSYINSEPTHLQSTKKYLK